jgi:predicted nucleotidyltransferase
MTESLEKILAETRRSLEPLYGERLAQLVLFGSQARGNAVLGSDIDLLVVLRGPVDPGKEIARTSKVIASLSLKHDIVISCTFVSSERYSTEQSPLLLNVRREGVPV